MTSHGGSESMHCAPGSGPRAPGSSARAAHRPRRRSRARRGAGAAVGIAAIAVALGACDRRIPTTWKSPAPPAIDSAEGFARLWSTNCAGCHGADGTLGPARPMNDRAYLAAIDDRALTSVISNGSPPGTLMPGFARSKGGALSDGEIAAIVQGMRRAWGASTGSVEPPESPAIPYAVTYGTNASPKGDAARGKVVFDQFCAACHVAPKDMAPPKEFAGSVTDPFFLQLVSDQAIRSAIIFGRTDLGMPGARGPFPGAPEEARLSARDVDDLVAWFAQRRAQDWPPKGVGRGGAP